MNQPTEKPVFATESGGYLFQVYAAPADHGRAYLGFCDGVLSVSGDTVDVTLRALARKHAEPKRTAQVIDFTAEKLKRLGAVVAA
ncbi:hypothetical protein D869_gp290 [Caulobacter phage CcrRogue]|uniref:Uncharacterized protein n=1 Tax=Caulobacter phage CcrRogue TaxID=2927986 RepID=K4JN35_9CAUD|nr:hypothetical protein D869_gp290 [Caulobacter phage CcrRogue]AFU86624.1 hypothetical protein CcrRogue_gp142 [Caulobacter phage CcrRogue]